MLIKFISNMTELIKRMKIISAFKITLTTILNTKFE